MGTIKVQAGDFIKNPASRFMFGDFVLYTDEHPVKGEHIPASKIESIDIATEENVKKIGGTLGWGLVGSALLGPAGLVAGLLLGGRKKEVTFVAKFTDGRKIMATTNAKTYTKIRAVTF